MPTATNASNFSTLLQRYFQKELLKYPVQLTQFIKFGQKAIMQENAGNNSTCWVRFNAPDDSEVITITEGSRTSTSSGTITPTRVNASFSQYGVSADISDLAKSLNAYDIMKVAAQRLRENVALKNDTLVRNELVTGTAEAGGVAITELYPAGITGTTSALRFTMLATTTTSAAVLAVTDFVNAAAALEINRAPYHDGGYFIAFIDPRVGSDIQKDSNWLNTHQYKDSEMVYEGELGKWGNIKFIRHTNPFLENVKGTFVSAGSVISTIVCGKDAYGVCDIASMPALTPSVQFLNSAEKSDLYNTTQFVIAKYLMAQRILNGNYAVNLRSKTSYVAPVA